VVRRSSRHDREEARRREAAEVLHRVRHDGNHAIGSALVRAVQHFLANDAAAGQGDAPDPIERWGRRIGRALSLLAFIGLCAYLYATYLR
jgi:hypothetical protein